MWFIKIALAIILLLIASILGVGEFRLIVGSPGTTVIEQHDRLENARLPWHEHVSVILFIALCGCAGYLLLRRPVDPIAGVHCPRCMAVGGHNSAPSYSRSVNPWARHFGGFLLSIFYSGSKQQRFRCRECTELFYAHTAVSQGYRLLFLLFVALIGLRIWAEFSPIWFGD